MVEFFSLRNGIHVKGLWCPTTPRTNYEPFIDFMAQILGGERIA